MGAVAAIPDQIHTLVMLSLRQRLRELLRLIGDYSSWQRRLDLLDDEPQRATQLLKDNLTVGLDRRRRPRHWRTPPWGHLCARPVESAHEVLTGATTQSRRATAPWVRRLARG
jgi:hypothetical protein